MQVRQRLRKLGRLTFAKGQFAMGTKSPLDPKVLGIAQTATRIPGTPDPKPQTPDPKTQTPNPRPQTPYSKP